MDPNRATRQDVGPAPKECVCNRGTESNEWQFKEPVVTFSLRKEKPRETSQYRRNKISVIKYLRICYKKRLSLFGRETSEPISKLHWKIEFTST